MKIRWGEDYLCTRVKHGIVPLSVLLLEAMLLYSLNVSQSKRFGNAAVNSPITFLKIFFPLSVSLTFYNNAIGIL